MLCFPSFFLFFLLHFVSLKPITPVRQSPPLRRRDAICAMSTIRVQPGGVGGGWVGVGGCFASHLSFFSFCLHFVSLKPITPLRQSPPLPDNARAARRRDAICATSTIRVQPGGGGGLGWGGRLLCFPSFSFAPCTSSPSHPLRQSPPLPDNARAARRRDAICLCNPGELGRLGWAVALLPIFFFCTLYLKPMRAHPFDSSPCPTTPARAGLE